MPVPDGWFDTVTFNRNREAFTLEQLRPYFGRHVAWSLDGTRILADGATFDELVDRLEQSGLASGAAVFSFDPDPAVSYL